jgi:hypothetical protein
MPRAARSIWVGRTRPNTARCRLQSPASPRKVKCRAYRPRSRAPGAVPLRRHADRTCADGSAPRNRSIDWAVI